MVSTLARVSSSSRTSVEESAIETDFSCVRPYYDMQFFEESAFPNVNCHELPTGAMAKPPYIQPSSPLIRTPHIPYILPL